MSTLQLGLAQTRQTADLDTNAETILRFLEDAAGAGVQLLAFPESQTTGYRVDISTPDAPVPADALDALHQRGARRCGELGIACILGTETPTDGKPHNSALVINERTNAKLVEVNFKLASERLKRCSDAASRAKLSADLDNCVTWGRCTHTSCTD